MNPTSVALNSRDDMEGHLEEVKRITVDAAKPLAARRGAEGDAFDLLLIIYVGLGLPPLRWYFDWKSPRPDIVESVDKYVDPTTELEEYLHVKKIYELQSELTPLYCNPFRFCYWTHYPGSLSVRECLVLREEETKSFLGPMWPIFVAFRASMK